MNPPRAAAPTPRGRLGAVLLTAMLLAGAFSASLAPTATLVLHHGVLAASLADLVLLSIGAAGTLAAAWYALTAAVLLICCTATQRSRRSLRRLAAISHRWGAPGLRRLATAGAVIGLLGASAPALAAPVVADDLSWGSTTPTASDVAPTAASSDTQETAPTPEEAPTPENTTTPDGLTPPSSPASNTYTVKAGDCLWNIARRALPEGASNAAIASEWQSWYQHNRAVIGANPDLLHPGQILHAPSLS